MDSLRCWRSASLGTQRYSRRADDGNLPALLVRWHADGAWIWRHCIPLVAGQGGRHSRISAILEMPRFSCY